MVTGIYSELWTHNISGKLTEPQNKNLQDQIHVQRDIPVLGVPTISSDKSCFLDASFMAHNLCILNV